MENFEDFKWGDAKFTSLDISENNEVSIRDGKETKTISLKEYMENLTLAARGSNGKNEQFKKSLEELKDQIDLMRAQNQIK